LWMFKIVESVKEGDKRVQYVSRFRGDSLFKRPICQLIFIISLFLNMPL
jgi:hypothetical protein